MNRVADFVFEQFIATGKPVRLSDVAKALKTSVAKVNEEAWEAHSAVDRTEIEVETRSAYGAFGPSRYRLVPALQPSREEMARRYAAAVKGA